MTCGNTSPASCDATSAGEIPEETAGPYPGDGSNGPDVLEQSGIVRQDIRSSFGGATGVAEGIPLTLELTLSDLVNGGAPFTGVAVYVWHCTREGGYSMYSEGIEGENLLRGVQIATSQVALPKNICDTVYAQPGYEASVDNLAKVSLDSDMVFGDDGAAQQLATVTGDVTTGYTAALHVAIDTNTEPGGGGTPPPPPSR